MPSEDQHPNILDAMREVEAAAEWRDQLGYTTSEFRETDFQEDECSYIAAAANHAPDIVKFARRLLEVLVVAPAPGHAPQDIFNRRLDALERDYPGCLEDKRDA